MKNMKFFKKLSLIIFTIATVTAVLTGCRERFDCSGYIKSMLDATYKGDFESYALMTKSTLDAIEKDYNSFIEHETDVWLQYCGFSAEDIIPGDLKNQVTEFIKTLYKEASYTLKEADKNGNVELTVKPVNIYNAVQKEYDQFNMEFKERNDNYEFSDYSDEDFTRAYLEPVIEIFKKHLTPVPYQEPIVVTIQVLPDDSGRYGISDDDVTTLYSSIINYTISN